MTTITTIHALNPELILTTRLKLFTFTVTSSHSPTIINQQQQLRFEMDKLSSELFIHNDFPHISQKRDWDCGIACVAMVMVGLGKYHECSGDNNDGKLEFYRILDKLQNDVLYGFGRRPWTIDLCHILQRLKLPYKHFTSHSGMTVNEALFKLNYYGSATFQQDSSRIADLLRDNPELTVHTTLTIPHMDDVTFFKYLEHGPLLVLTDGGKLQCHRCTSKNVVKFTVKKIYQKLMGFVGHYVLVVGWRNRRDCDGNDKATDIYYRDPAVLDEMCATKLKHFNEARLAFGTDGDIIAILKSQSKI